MLGARGWATRRGADDAQAALRCIGASGSSWRGKKIRRNTERKKTEVAVNHSQHSLHRPRTTWTISLGGPTCKGYQTAKNKYNKDGMAYKIEV